MSGLIDGRDKGGPTKRKSAHPIYRWAMGCGRSALVGYRVERRATVAALPKMPRWDVARVHAGFEFAVADDLSASGFFGYAPHRVVVHGHARLDGSNSKRRRVERDYPLIPGYVFVGSDGGGISRRWHDSIVAVVSNPQGRPVVSQAAMDRFCALHIELLKPPAPLAKGDAVDLEVLGRRIAGVVAELREGCVRVDIEMFGQVVPVEAAIDTFKRAVV